MGRTFVFGGFESGLLKMRSVAASATMTRQALAHTRRSLSTSSPAWRAQDRACAARRAASRPSGRIRTRASARARMTTSSSLAAGGPASPLPCHLLFTYPCPLSTRRLRRAIKRVQRSRRGWSKSPSQMQNYPRRRPPGLLPRNEIRIITKTRDLATMAGDGAGGVSCKAPAGPYAAHVELGSAHGSAHALGHVRWVAGTRQRQ